MTVRVNWLNLVALLVIIAASHFVPEGLWRERYFALWVGILGPPAFRLTRRQER